jgi:ketosteroid isomerase-like protein
VPWAPELFSAPALARLLAKRRRAELLAVPFFYGLTAGELDALIESFVDEPVVYDPVRGRIRGIPEFEAFVIDMKGWLADHNVSVENVDHVILPARGFEEVILHLHGESGPVDLPVAIVADRRRRGRIQELRIYYSGWQLTGAHINRPPLLQPDPALRPPDYVTAYLSALAAGDVDAIVDAFEPDGYAREPAGGPYVHQGHEQLRVFYDGWCSNSGGIPLERCAIIEGGDTCVLEYNIVQWGDTKLSPQAGVAVFTRGPSGKLASARMYDDADPPVAREP